MNGTGAGPQNGSVAFDGGMLRATADQIDFVRNFALIRAGARGAFIDSDGHRIGIDSSFIGPGGLNKLGQGALDLRGMSFLDGLSTVQAGTLLVNGTLAGDMRVESGATLGGSGRIEGLVTVSPGGIVSPGNSPGTLTVGSLVLGPQSSLVIELGASSDHLVVLSDVSLAGTLFFTGDASFLFGNSFESFLTYGGTLVENGIVIGSLPGGLDPASYMLDFSTPGALSLTAAVHAVPEPGTYLLMTLGCLLLLWKCRGRMRQQLV